MITICFDAKKQCKDKYDVLIEGISDYVSGYSKIHAALHDRKDCFVVVRNRQIYEVFIEQEKYYAHEMEHKVYSVKSNFKDRYHISVPDYITESDLIEDTSLIKVDFASGENFENAVLRSEFGNFFLGTSFPFNTLAQLCGNITLDSLKDEKRTVLRKVFKKRLLLFKRNIRGEYEEYVFDQFITNFQELKADVAVYLLIKDFPRDFKEDILGHDLCKCMDNLGVTGAYIMVDKKRLDDYCDRFKMYVSKKEVSPETLLRWVSGRYKFELDQIIKIIRDKKLPIEDYLDQLVFRFNLLFEQMPEEKLRLNNIKPPVVLEKPGSKFNIHNWLDWAIDNYLPYRFWLEYNGELDQRADDYAGLFGDYIFNNYDFLVSNYQGMMYKVLPGIKDELLENKHTLFVVLDNFNYKFLDYLISRMNNERFVVRSQKPVLSMIPTETAISKRALFTAEAYNDNGESYDIIVKRWAKNLGVEMQYLPNVGSLQKLKSMEKKVYFLNYLRIDQMLHEDLSTSAQKIEIRIQKELDALVDEISRILRQHGIEKDTNVYFIADHGSTRILPKQSNGIDPKYYKDKAQESDYRFIEVKDVDYEETKAAIGNLCYALDKERYGTSGNYFIARGYNRFIKSELDGYVHGAITPEEIIVPFVKFSYDVDMCKDPEIILINDNLRFAVKLKLVFMVKNYNEFPIEDVEITIQNSNVKYSKGSPILIDSLETGSIELSDARITKALDKKKNEKLYVTMNYSANGRKHGCSKVIEMSIKSAQSGGTDLSDLL